MSMTEEESHDSCYHSIASITSESGSTDSYHSLSNPTEQSTEDLSLLGEELLAVGDLHNKIVENFDEKNNMALSPSKKMLPDSACSEHFDFIISAVVEETQSDSVFENSILECIGVDTNTSNPEILSLDVELISNVEPPLFPSLDGLNNNSTQLGDLGQALQCPPVLQHSVQNSTVGSSVVNSITVMTMANGEITLIPSTLTPVNQLTPLAVEKLSKGKKKTEKTLIQSQRTFLPKSKMKNINEAGLKVVFIAETSETANQAEEKDLCTQTSAVNTASETPTRRSKRITSRVLATARHQSGFYKQNHSSLSNNPKGKEKPLICQPTGRTVSKAVVAGCSTVNQAAENVPITDDKPINGSSIQPYNLEVSKQNPKQHSTHPVKESLIKHQMTPALIELCKLAKQACAEWESSKLDNEKGPSFEKSSSIEDQVSTATNTDPTNFFSTPTGPHCSSLSVLHLNLGDSLDMSISTIPVSGSTPLYSNIPCDSSMIGQGTINLVVPAQPSTDELPREETSLNKIRRKEKRKKRKHRRLPTPVLLTLCDLLRKMRINPQTSIPAIESTSVGPAQSTSLLFQPWVKSEIESEPAEKLSSPMINEAPMSVASVVDPNQYPIYPVSIRSLIKHEHWMTPALAELCKLASQACVEMESSKRDELAGEDCSSFEKSSLIEDQVSTATTDPFNFVSTPTGPRCSSLPVRNLKLGESLDTSILTMVPGSMLTVTEQVPPKCPNLFIEMDPEYITNTVVNDPELMAALIMGQMAMLPYPEGDQNFLAAPYYIASSNLHHFDPALGISVLPPQYYAQSSAYQNQKNFSTSDISNHDLTSFAYSTHLPCIDFNQFPSVLNTPRLESPSGITHLIMNQTEMAIDESAQGSFFNQSVGNFGWMQRNYYTETSFPKFQDEWINYACAAESAYFLQHQTAPNAAAALQPSTPYIRSNAVYSAHYYCAQGYSTNSAYSSTPSISQEETPLSNRKRKSMEPSSNQNSSDISSTEQKKSRRSLKVSPGQQSIKIDSEPQATRIQPPRSSKSKHSVLRIREKK